MRTALVETRRGRRALVACAAARARGLAGSDGEALDHVHVDAVLLLVLVPLLRTMVDRARLCRLGR
jgi:hypothetical protein